MAEIICAGYAAMIFFVIDDPICDTCGIPADIDNDYPAEGFECGWCRKGGFRFDRARSLGLYDSVLKELIHFYKYRNQPGGDRRDRTPHAGLF